MVCPAALTRGPVPITRLPTPRVPLVPLRAPIGQKHGNAAHPVAQPAQPALCLASFTRTIPSIMLLSHRRWFTELGDFVILKEHGGMEVRQ